VAVVCGPFVQEGLSGKSRVLVVTCCIIKRHLLVLLHTPFLAASIRLLSCLSRTHAPMLQCITKSLH
jgi:hypothetical protein